MTRREREGRPALEIGADRKKGKAPESPGHPPDALTGDQEVTLRRIAFGQSELRSLRRGDVARLRTLGLIQDGKDGLELTSAGRRCFDALPKAIIQTQGRRSFAQILSEAAAKRRR